MRKRIRQADGSIRAEPLMDIEHAASAVLYMASLPLAANVQFHGDGEQDAVYRPWLNRTHQ